MIAGLVVGLLLGFPFGVVFGVRMIRRRAYLVCQRQALIDRGYRPAVADGFNPVPPQTRRRSPDLQPIWQHFPGRPSRPVFHDDRR